MGLIERAYQSEVAQESDIVAIVDLLMTDKEYISVYNRAVLEAQMYDRFSSEFSRYFIVRKDGKIVAACTTYGEVEGFALVGGVIVDPQYRRQGLAKDVEEYACHILEKEGVSRVGFVNFNNHASLALHEKLGAYPIASLAKMVRNE